MQGMDALHAIYGLYILNNFFNINLFWHALQKDMGRFQNYLNRAYDNNYAYADAYERVGNKPVRIVNDDTAYNNANGCNRIPDNMEVCASYIQIFMSMPFEP